MLRSSNAGVTAYGMQLRYLNKAIRVFVTMAATVWHLKFILLTGTSVVHTNDEYFNIKQQESWSAKWRLHPPKDTANREGAYRVEQPRATAMASSKCALPRAPLGGILDSDSLRRKRRAQSLAGFLPLVGGRAWRRKPI